MADPKAGHKSLTTPEWFILHEMNFYVISNAVVDTKPVASQCFLLSTKLDVNIDDK